MVGAGSGDASARGAIEHADLHQIRLVHFFDGIFFFAENGSESAEADGTTAIFIQQGNHQIAIDFIEAVLIDAEHLEGILGDLAGDTAVGAYFREVAGASQQAIGDPRCAAATSGNFFSTALIQLNIQDFGGAIENDEEIFGLVKIESVNDAEAGAKGRGDEPGASGGANQREMAEGKRMNAGAGALANDEVDAKIFHGGIEDFFDGGLQAMNFVEKENLFGFERSENRGEVAFRSRRGPALVLMGTFNSLAMICARVVLPRPGGPYSRTWSRASPRLRAASRAIAMFSLTRFWPMYSSRRLGRTLASMRASSSQGAPETMREERSGASSLRRGMDFLGVKSGIFFRVSFAYAFGALRAASATRNNFSKLDVPASRLASDTALSTVRSS